MYKIAVVAKKPLQLHLMKDGQDIYVSSTRPGEIYYTESLNRGLTYLHKDRVVKITEARNPVTSIPVTSIQEPVREAVLEPLKAESAFSGIQEPAIPISESSEKSSEPEGVVPDRGSIQEPISEAKSLRRARRSRGIHPA